MRFQAILGTSGNIDFWRKFHFFFSSNCFSGAGGKKHGFSGFFNLARAQIFDTDFSGTSRLRGSTRNSVGFLLRPFSGRVVGLNPYSLTLSQNPNTFAGFTRKKPQRGSGINPRFPLRGVGRLRRLKAPFRLGAASQPPKGRRKGTGVCVEGSIMDVFVCF